MRHPELHRTSRIGWLRASVLGANDSLISTASLIVGVAAAGSTSQAVLVSGVAGLLAGALSMAAGEYVSVSSQADTEQADLARERAELAADPASEHAELTAIWAARGLTLELAGQVATQLTAHDALGAHARDELGLIEMHAARPIQAALASAGSFAVGAALPLAMVLVAPSAALVPRVVERRWSCWPFLAGARPGQVVRPCSGAPCGCASGGRSPWGSPRPPAHSSARSPDRSSAPRPRDRRRSSSCRPSPERPRGRDVGLAPAFGAAPAGSQPSGGSSGRSEACRAISLIGSERWSP